jgi:Pyruvate/2-oxoacid:ferredoxin oxidoreductase gamma subunit
VLLYDQTCAAEKRRRRKRGKFPDPDQRVFINPAVCEGCGDCGVKSNCVAVSPLDTELGTKRAIDQSACNKDFSCLNGFCPSFVTVHGAKLRKSPIVQRGDTSTAAMLANLPEPKLRSLDTPYTMLVTGLGGTGVVTLSAVLGQAAHLEGKGFGSIDMTGLAQKGGAVACHMRVARNPDQIHAIRAGVAGADLVLGCDLVVTASNKVLETIKPDHTAVVYSNYEMATADFTRNANLKVPGAALRHAIEERAGKAPVYAFDAHTGKQVWSFRPIPQPGEFGNDTWGADSWSYTCHTNAWPPMTLDAARGLVYVPLGTPSNDFYGGRRPGANVFAESLVCLDAATGVRKWHAQLVHHGLWDYDNPSPPNLVTIRVDGRTIDAVVQLTKQGFAFVFDRMTGTPVWPIEERPVPPSDVEGEHAWPTQPVPTKPPAIAEQGVTLDDAIDFTPELKAAAQQELKKYRIGPLFTPPSLRGTVQRPGLIGGANWGGGAFDPSSGVLFVKTTNQANIARIGKPDRSAANPRASEVDAELTRVGDTNAEFMDGLPLLKPPYGHLVAIDLNRGAIKWRVPFGDTPSLRRHPALKGVALPPALGAAGAPGVVVTAGGLVIGGGGDLALHAVDAATGAEVWHAALPRRVNGTPMIYRSRSGRQFVVVATGGGEDASLVAFALDGKTNTGGRH